MGITGMSISLATSLNKLTSDSIHIVLVMTRCGEFVSGCTMLALAECSNLLVHCSIKITSATAARTSLRIACGNRMFNKVYE